MGEELVIGSAGNFISGEYVKEKGITEFDISNARNVEFEKDGKKKTRVQVDIAYKNQGKDDPNTWTMNQTSARVLAEHFGSVDSDKWHGKIPVETAPTEKGRAIYVDKVELKKKQGVLA